MIKSTYNVLCGPIFLSRKKIAILLCMPNKQKLQLFKLNLSQPVAFLVFYWNSIMN